MSSVPSRAKSASKSHHYSKDILNIFAKVWLRNELSDTRRLPERFWEKSVALVRGALGRSCLYSSSKEWNVRISCMELLQPSFCTSEDEAKVKDREGIGGNTGGERC